MPLSKSRIITPQFSVAAFAPILMIAGCSLPDPSGPDYKEPQSSLPSSYRFETTKNGRKAAKRDRWWTIFGDSGLNRLLGQVRGSNQELRGGLARVDQARATLRIAGAQTAPSISTSPSVNRNRTSGAALFGGNTFTNFSIPLDASWEIDLFGRIRRNIEAAGADADASADALDALRLSLEAEAASGYFTLCALDREIDVVRDEVSGRESTLKLAEDRFELGAVSKLDVSQARSELAANKADLASLQRQRIAQESALAILAGQPASGFSIPHSPLKGKVPRIPNSLPSELLRARPDIRAAERRVAAANARIGVAQAAFYPSVTLNGQAGLSSNTTGDLFTKRAQFWSIGPDVYLPIFAGGELRANLALSKAQYEEVLADYQQTVLESLSEVENRLAATQLLSVEERAQSEAVTAARAARQTARDQYNGGIVDFLIVLDAERTTLTAERAQAVLSGSEFINTVNLITAIGGRW